MSLPSSSGRAPGTLDRDAFAHALRREQARRDLSQEELAALLGVTQQTVSDWMSQKKAPSKKNLARVVDTLGLDASKLTSSPAIVTPDVVLIPRNGYVGAGEGREDDAHEYHADPYPARELRRLTQRNPDGLRSAVVIGDSMYPELRANDTVIYAPTNSIGDAGLYVLRLDGAHIVKTVQRLGGGALDLIPRNTDLYHRERYTPCPDADTPNTYRSDLTGLTSILEVVGKVVFYPKPA